ncbi:GntR family transcriptional regulator [Pectobacteriaceae bacterium CE70]|uniref:GntR family transcriptional regulator n=1 Tax=Serratia sp. (strain ATCC 39006) TaxID=104623 RepID=A0A2I5TPY6_SERS3|nr:MULTISPECIES: GntR family transcriptional regulator [Enterobacterales]WJV58756.1 GntR family transcriptional regulator [Pectobacteriaceae bacterium C111]WJV63071.1 GntR family transcriptional regulator [Pectobacteriaceae bacterium C52]WJV67393.1 GntR family transcriptional regulator [Pectobacteriaceae bacterium CE70]WJY11374.1 GntR family transcriptional regulator [Pectobacteriaceae bacterium C80]WJY14570.1 GntR family transcriptional regulator [Pectobacteriaceae bacterium CE90]
MSVSQKTARSADSVEKVYEVVKALAIDYHFKPGERVNEVELASRLGVSRTPVREALNRLAQDGFMNFVPNRGFYSRDITPDGVRELYELRAVIEQAAFRFACQRASDSDIAQTVAIWEQSCRELPDPDTITDWTKVAEADEAFHMSIARIAKNSRLYETLDGLNSLIRFFRRIDLETPSRRNNAYDEHVEIIAALRQRDVETGIPLIETHVSLSAEHAVEVTKEGLARIYFRKLI